ncbi:MAG: hypothetical protein AB8B49_02205 [Nitratireductor sp.]
MLAEQEEPKAKLPALRQEITISQGSPSWTGAPTWLIHDGFRNKYFRLDLAGFELLQHWRPITIEKFVTYINTKLDRVVEEAEVSQLVEFLYANSLTQTSSTQSWEAYHQQNLASKKGWFSSLMHNYIFFRIPLFRPQKFLDLSWPIVSLLFSKMAVYAYLFCALLGLYLVSRQWQVFQSTFLDFLTLDGLLTYGFSMVFIKMVHELGHAFMTRKYNVDVPIIGAAFIVLMPILYTDTTGATKLPNKRQRLMIDMAGIYAELVLASLCTLLWVLLPDGPLRSVAFTTATLSWVMSLLVNLNPFMRFDGYYILSDLFEMENLQERSFALARWQIRKFLFGLTTQAPEALPKLRRNLLILHSWGTWIYRFFLFLGIAILVYAFFIKLIGILLFVVEILWFILLPIYREIKHWWSIKEEIFKMKRYIITGSTALILVVLFLLPLSTKVSVPTIYAHQDKVTLYAPLPSKVESHNLKNGWFVQKGDVLIQLHSDSLQSQLALTRLHALLLKTRISRIGADASERSLRLVLAQELESKLRSYKGLLDQKERLKVRAPISGKLSFVDTNISNGTWLNTSNPIATIKPNNVPSFLGYVSEMDVDRIEIGRKGHFLSNSGEFHNIDLVINKRAKIAASSLSDPYLADIHGGALPVVQQGHEQTNGELNLRGGWYPLEMTSVNGGHENLDQVVTGVAIVNAKPISLGSKMFRRAASILIRELGF